MGASGGVLLMWDNKVVDKVEEAVGCFSVSCKFKNMVDHFVWAFTGGMCLGVWEVILMWCGFLLNVLVLQISLQICIGFQLLFPSKTLLICLWLGGISLGLILKRLLLDLDWTGFFCQQIGRRNFHLFFNAAYLGCFWIISQSFLRVGIYTKAKKSFKFENMWLKDEGFLEWVSSWWESYLFQGTQSFSLANKLKMLKSDLKRWNVEEFSNIGLRVQNLWKDFNVLEVVEDDRVLTTEESREKDRIRGELEKTTLLEEIYWRQKSRALFLKEEDRNTKFFHRIANFHRRCNTIDRLMVDGELSTDQELIEGCITQF